MRMCPVLTALRTAQPGTESGRKLTNEDIVVDNNTAGYSSFGEDSLARVWPLLHEHIPNGIYTFRGLLRM